MNANIDMLMTCDEMAREGVALATEADLTWASHVRSARVNVKRFFENADNFDGIVLARSVGTWRKATSQASKLLTILVKLSVTYTADEDIDCGPFADTVSDVARAMVALECWNALRIANDDTQVWGVQGLLDILAPATPKAGKATETVTAPVTPDTEVTVVAEPAETTDHLAVLLAALPNLTVAELGTLATAVAQERTRKATLVIAA